MSTRQVEEIFNSIQGSSVAHNEDVDIEAMFLDFSAGKKQYYWQHVQDKFIIVLFKNEISHDFQHISQGAVDLNFALFFFNVLSF